MGAFDSIVERGFPAYVRRRLSPTAAIHWLTASVLLGTGERRAFMDTPA